MKILDSKIGWLGCLLAVFLLGSVDMMAQPANDNCDGTVTVTDVTADGTVYSVSGDGTGATDGLGAGATHVWEAFTTTECATVSIAFCNSENPPTNVFISVTDCPVTAAVNGVTETCNVEDFIVIWEALPAGTYYYPVMADAVFGGDAPYTIEISAEPCEAGGVNSLCDGAIAINEGIYTDAITAGTGGASNLCFGDDPAAASVWYEYTATATGLATVSSSIDADLPDTRVSVHTGTCAEPTCLVSDDDAGEGFTSIVEFPVIEGEVFLIEWDDRWGTDEFDFEVSVASGDDCPSPDAIICDNIDDYELGPMNGQGAHWSTWGGTLGGADDGIVTDEQAFSNANSVLIAEGQTQDVILLLGNQTTGTWDISWMEYVPADATAYYNIQEDEVPGVAWNLDVFFNQGGAAPGEGVITTTGSTFSYPEDAWFAVEMSLDLDNDLISVTIDGIAVDVDAPYAGSIGSINFFSIDATNRYYLDDLVWDGDSGIDPGSDCLSAIDISAGGMFSSAEVTGALEDFAGTCWTGPALTANNWFFYTASADGILTVTTVDIGGTDTEVAAATGDCGALTEIACDEDFTGSAPWESEIAFPVTEGETYYIIWGNGWNGDPFDFEVSLDFPTEPCPDPGAIICDNFDDYALDMIAGQAAHWADWPGGSTSSMVSTEQAFSNTQSLNVAEGGVEDQLLLLGDQTTGVWTVDFMMYVPAGSNGYYNLQNTEATGQWNFDIFFNAGGAGDYQENQVSISPFTFPEDQWFEMSHTVDLNNLVVTIELDGAVVHTGPYIGDMVGCVNFYSIDATNNYFIDDVIVNGNPEVGVIEYTENAFTVYPNPTNSMLTISGEEQIDAVVLRDMLGSVVRQLDTPFSNQVTLDVADLSKGVYFVEVRVGDVVNVSRVIKN